MQRPLGGTLLVVLFVVAVAIAADRDESRAIGARITTCSGCRLNSLHEVRQFIREEMRTYPAIDIQYISGRDPIIEFLNRFGRVVKTVDLAPYDRRQIHLMVQEQGIHPWTAKPTFEPYTFEATAHCVAWRQTGDCNPKGPREASQDEECNAAIGVGRSGYCECSGGRGFVEVDCLHKPLICEVECSSAPVATAEPTVAIKQPVPPADEEGEF